MTMHDERELEAQLRTALVRLAPEPSGGLLDRTLATVAETPQRRRAEMLTAAGAGWKWAAASVVVAAGVVAGVVIGSSLTPPTADRPGASSVPPTIEPSESAPPSSETSPPVAPGTWERIDLPDPAPGAFTSTRASDVVAFHNLYVAIGSFSAYCSSDIHETPPNCDAAIDALPSTLGAAVWLSQDARTWELLPHQAAFEGAGMQHAATDGERIVVTGVGFDLDARPRVVWVSGDGRSWERIGPDGPLPEHLVSTEEGFIGARQTDDGPQFVASDDGRSWRALTNPGDHGPGEVMGMAVGLDGTTVVAVGVTYEYSDDGELLRITGTSWFSADGVTWERAPANDGHEGAWMSSAAESEAGWLAVGLDQTTDAGPSETAVWTSADGIVWTRVELGSLPLTPYGSADAVVWTGEEIVATGTLAGEGGSVIGFWLSPDGASWDAVEGQPALDSGTPDRLVALDGWALAVGVRFAGPDHMVGVVWIASP